MINSLKAAFQVLPEIFAVVAFVSAVMLILIRALVTSTVNRSQKTFEQTLIAQNETLRQKAKDSYQKEAQKIEDIWSQVYEIHRLCGSMNKDKIEDHEDLDNLLKELGGNVHRNEPYLTAQTVSEIEAFMELASQEGPTGRSFDKITDAQQRVIKEFRGRLIIDE